MSKNLEKEYKDLYEQEMSNVDMDALWNKIEAALPEKEVTEKAVAVNKEEKDADVIQFSSKKKWYQNAKTIQTIGTLAACAVVLLVVSAGFSRSGLFKSQYSASDSHKGQSEAPSQMTTMDSAMNEAAAEIDAETEVESAPTVEESEACVSGENIYTEFEVLAETEEYYLCVTLSENDIVEAEMEIYLVKREILEVGERYADDLVLVDDEGEIKIFEIN